MTRLIGVTVDRSSTGSLAGLAASERGNECVVEFLVALLAELLSRLARLVAVGDDGEQRVLLALALGQEQPAVLRVGAQLGLAQRELEARLLAETGHQRVARRGTRRRGRRSRRDGCCGRRGGVAGQEGGCGLLGGRGDCVGGRGGADVAGGALGARDGRGSSGLAISLVGGGLKEKKRERERDKKNTLRVETESGMIFSIL